MLPACFSYKHTPPAPWHFWPDAMRKQSDKLLRLLCGNERDGIYRVGQQKDFRLLQFAATEVIAHTVILISGDVVTELGQKRNSPVNGAAVDFDAIEGLIFAMLSRMGRMCSASEYSFRTSKRQLALTFSVSMVHILSSTYFT